MKRRNFLQLAALSGLGSLNLPFSSANPLAITAEADQFALAAGSGLETDVAIIGGGLGGCATALAVCRNGMRAILTEETDWLGGQISQQGVPPDEHSWIETHGAPSSYREYRTRVRDFYKRNYPLTADAKSRENLNPGNGSVSRICHEPKVCVAVLYEMLMPYLSSGQLQIFLGYKAQKADTQGDQVKHMTLRSEMGGPNLDIKARYFVDATECGDLLPLTKTEYITGTESKQETKELHAANTKRPQNHQAFTLCFAMDYQDGIDNTIDKPADYQKWRNFVPKMSPAWSGRLLDLSYSNPRDLKPKRLGFDPRGIDTPGALNLWNYRRMIHKDNFTPGFYTGDITIVNWPQNDYMMGNLIDVSDAEFKKTVDDARNLNMALFYWLQTEAPRADGGQGWKGLRLRGDIMGTSDGMAKYPYIREARRIKAETTVLEEHVGAENRLQVAGPKEGKKAFQFHDSVGVGYYHIDLHPSNQGDNYIDFGSLPYQIPLGSLLPVRMNNLFPANKNIGTTHITNGCYRLHPTEWGIGEAVGLLVAYADQHKIPARQVRNNKNTLADFQSFIQKQGIETVWKGI